MDRRTFLGFAASAALPGCSGRDEEDETFAKNTGAYDAEVVDEVYIASLPETYELGEEIEIEAGGSGNGFDLLLIEYQKEDGDDSWETLREETAFRHEGYTSARILESYSPEESGTYEFRARAAAGDGFVASETEAVEFVEEVNEGLEN